MGDIALDYDGTELLDEVIEQLAKEIETDLQNTKKVSEEDIKQLNKGSLDKIRELREKYEIK